MKIGVITWFRYENFGTALQAVALQMYLKNKGYDVELIDFKIPIPKNNYPCMKEEIYNVIGRLINKVDVIISKKEYMKKNRKFEDFIKNNCKISKYVESDEDYIKICNSYDCLIIGSDQIWNPNWYHPFYYANFDEIKTMKISYAPSFGISKIVGSKDAEDIKNALEKIRNISVREDTGISIVEDLTGKRPELVVDPTLLLKRQEWEVFESKNYQTEKYILCYMLTDNKKHWAAVKKYARLKKIKIVVLPNGGHSLVQSKSVIRDAGPSDFLALVKNAECVITDSFHALVFSSIYQKKLILFERHDSKLSGSGNSRIYNFLNLLNVKEKLLPFETNVISDKDVVDFKKEGNGIMGLVESSKEYLEGALNGK